jgi:hypothetical protein
MTKKDKILKIIIHLTGLIALYIFIFSRTTGGLNYLLDKDILRAYDNLEYGDLYFLNFIDNYKIPTPPISKEYYESIPNSDINDADILIFGDSFFTIGPRVKNVPGRLVDTLKKNIFFIQTNEVRPVLEAQKYLKKDKKYLILELVERVIPMVFTKKQNADINKSQLIDFIIENAYPVDLEKKYSVLLQKSFLTHFIYKELASFKFNLFGNISSLTPLYKKNPPWLFYYQEVNKKTTSFYYKFSDEEIKSICDGIQELSIFLKDKYNIEFIFFPIPNKYTIYHKILNNDEYNNFLPRIYAELNRRNVKVCEIYEKFINSDKELYYPTDTHWNAEGVNLAVPLLLRFLKFD